MKRTESTERREEICQICLGSHEDNILEDEGTDLIWFRCDRCWEWYFERCLQREYPGEPENVKKKTAIGHVGYVPRR